MSNSMLNIGLIHAPVVVLGPGVRVGLWLKGCDRECHGCIATDLWDSYPESLQSVHNVFEEIEILQKKTNANGITISGGEPFNQADGLYTFLTLCKTYMLNDILIYTGYQMDFLLKKYKWIPDLVTAVVDGAYEEDNPSTDLWRGSGNQTLSIYDEQYNDVYKNWLFETERKVQIVTTKDSLVWFLGIPQQKDYELLKNELKRLKL